VVIKRAEAKMNTLTLINPTAIRPLLAIFERIYKDINTAKGLLTYDALVHNINKILPYQYKNFIEH